MSGLAQILQACARAEAGLKEGGENAPLVLQECLEGMAKARLSDEELGQAGKALLKLRALAEGKAKYFRLRGQLSKTLSRVMGGAVQPGPKVDLTF